MQSLRIFNVVHDPKRKVSTISDPDNFEDYEFPSWDGRTCYFVIAGKIVRAYATSMILVARNNEPSSLLWKHFHQGVETQCSNTVNFYEIGQLMGGN